jgi:hypothetical protein
MPKAVKDKREVIREAIRRYRDPVERGAYVLGRRLSSNIPSCATS